MAHWKNLCFLFYLCLWIVVPYRLNLTLQTICSFFDHIRQSRNFGRALQLLNVVDLLNQTSFLHKHNATILVAKTSKQIQSRKCSETTQFYKDVTLLQGALKNC